MEVKICLVSVFLKYFQEIFLKMIENMEMSNSRFQLFQFDSRKYFQYERGGTKVINEGSI